MVASRLECELVISSGITTLHLRLERRFIGPLGLRRNPRQVSPLSSLPVEQCRVLGDTVIPYHDSVFCPLNPYMEVGAESEVII